MNATMASRKSFERLRVPSLEMLPEDESEFGIHNPTDDEEEDSRSLLEACGGKDQLEMAMPVLKKLYQLKAEKDEANRGDGDPPTTKDHWTTLAGHVKNSGKSPPSDKFASESIFLSKLAAYTDHHENFRRQSLVDRFAVQIRGQYRVQELPNWAKEFLKHAILLFSLFLYTMIGGLMFFYVESKEWQRSGCLNIEFAAMQKAIKSSVENPPSQEIIRLLNSTLLTLNSDLCKVVVRGYLDWVFYSVTVYTTIGYGTIYCESTAGRAITIVYAIIGIPLLCTCLADVSHVILEIVKAAKAKTGKLKDRIMKFRKGQENEKSDPSKSAISSVASTLIIVFVFLVIYLLVCSALIDTVEEEWGGHFFTSFYFIFVTFSTIGFGDLVPSDPIVRVLSSFLFLFGLAIASVCWTAIQESIENEYIAALQVLEAAYSKAKQKQKKCGVKKINSSGGGKMKLFSKSTENSPV